MISKVTTTPPPTSRIRFRHFVAGDAESIAELLLDRQAMRHYPVEFSREDADAWVQRNLDRYARGEPSLWVVERVSDGAFLGDCGVRLITINNPVLSPGVSPDGLLHYDSPIPATVNADGTRTYPGAAFVDVGYHFLPGHRGQGYATEAAAACIRFGKSALGVSRIFATILPVNTESQGVARRAGMELVGHVMHWNMHHDLWRA